MRIRLPDTGPLGQLQEFCACSSPRALRPAYSPCYPSRTPYPPRLGSHSRSMEQAPYWYQNQDAFMCRFLLLCMHADVSPIYFVTRQLSVVSLSSHQIRPWQGCSLPKGRLSRLRGSMHAAVANNGRACAQTPRQASLLPNRLHESMHTAVTPQQSSVRLNPRLVGSTAQPSEPAWSAHGACGQHARTLRHWQI